jgi:hypothetical protein
MADGVRNQPAEAGRAIEAYSPGDPRRTANEQVSGARAPVRAAAGSGVIAGPAHRLVQRRDQLLVIDKGGSSMINLRWLIKIELCDQV